MQGLSGEWEWEWEHMYLDLYRRRKMRRTKFKIYVHIFPFLTRIETCVGRQYLYLRLNIYIYLESLGPCIPCI